MTKKKNITFSALVAVTVSVFGNVEVGAKTKEEAIAKLRKMYKQDQLYFADIDWDGSREPRICTLSAGHRIEALDNDISLEMPKTKREKAVSTIAVMQEAHDSLSEALENPECGNDEVRDAAIAMCDALNKFWEECRRK